jgi:putative hydrolase
MLAAIANPLVDGISHPGNAAFPLDLEQIVRAAKTHGKTLEINNSSYKVRPGSWDNCRAIALLCKKHNVPITCASDAHYCADIGIFDKVLTLLNEIDFPPALIVNLTLESWESFVRGRRTARKQ